MGQYFGLAFLSPALFWISAEFGWRSLFLLVGIGGVLFGLVWLALYRDPHAEHAREWGGARIYRGRRRARRQGRSTPFAWRNIALLLRQRQVLGASIGQFASNSTLVFFLTWFPTYLATERQMAYIKVGFFAVLPFLGATVGVVSGGYGPPDCCAEPGRPTSRASCRSSNVG